MAFVFPSNDPEGDTIRLQFLHERFPEYQQFDLETIYTKLAQDLSPEQKKLFSLLVVPNPPPIPPIFPIVVPLSLGLGYTSQQISNSYRSQTTIHNTQVSHNFGVSLQITSIQSRLNTIRLQLTQNGQDLGQLRQDILLALQQLQAVLIGNNQFLLQNIFQVIARVDSTRTDIRSLRDRVIALQNVVDTIKTISGENKTILEALQTQIEDDILPAVNRIDFYIQDTLPNRLNTLQTLLETNIGTLVDFIEATAVAFASFLESLNGITIALGLLSSEFNAALLLLDKHLSAEIAGLNNRFTELEKKIDTLESQVKKLPEEVALEVSYSVVGESYYRYDTTNRYYPTLIFLFKQVGVGVRLGRSQIKTRYIKDGTSITPEDIELLKTEVQSLANLQYKYGDVRLNYVSASKVFKTVINVEDAAEGKRLLSDICTVIHDPFREDLVTTTTGKKRPNDIRRSTPIADWEPLPFANPYGIYKLHRVVLLVNGMDKPYQIYLAQ